ncbi:MAG: DegT/DnrJ/EryC1/StrS family aminotransferase, partial [Candidatus Avispirillum sp.]
IDGESGTAPAKLLAALDEANIEGRYIWKPMHMQPVFRDAAFVSVGDKPVSEEIFERGVCLPGDTKMSDEDCRRVIGAVRRCFGK